MPNFFVRLFIFCLHLLVSFPDTVMKEHKFDREIQILLN